MTPRPYLSIVIPVHNEQEVLEELYERLTGSLDEIGKSYEIIFINDGSTDQSAHLLKKLKMQDEGCMLRAYHRQIVDLMAATGECTTFIPALALTYAANPTEVGVAHAERSAGKSSYSFYKLIRYNFDLVTGFSVFPLQMFTMIGVLISLCSFIFVIFLMLRRLIIGPEVEGVFTLFAIMFFLLGIVLFG